MAFRVASVIDATCVATTSGLNLEYACAADKSVERARDTMYNTHLNSPRTNSHKSTDLAGQAR